MPCCLAYHFQWTCLIFLVPWLLAHYLNFHSNSLVQSPACSNKYDVVLSLHSTSQLVVCVWCAEQHPQEVAPWTWYQNVQHDQCSMFAAVMAYSTVCCCHFELVCDRVILQEIHDHVCVAWILLDFIMYVIKIRHLLTTDLVYDHWTTVSFDSRAMSCLWLVIIALPRDLLSDLVILSDLERSVTAMHVSGRCLRPGLSDDMCSECKQHLGALLLLCSLLRVPAWWFNPLEFCSRSEQIG